MNTSIALISSNTKLSNKIENCLKSANYKVDNYEKSFLDKISKDYRYDFFVIDDEGYLGLGISDPAQEMHIYGATYPTMIIESSNDMGGRLQLIDTTATSELLNVDGDFRINTDGNFAMAITDSQHVGIGVTSPSKQLQLSLNSAGKPGDAEWDITSDERVKKDIRPFTDGLDVVLEIDPVWYKYNGKANTPLDEEYIGIVAQDMQEIAPYTIRNVSSVFCHALLTPVVSEN